MAKLYSKQYIGRLASATEPRRLIEDALRLGLDALESAGTPAWDTLRVSIALDDYLPEYHAITITITALED